jgi:hypothetical protein
MSLGRNYKRTYRITKNGRDFLQGDMFGQFVSLWTAFITVYNWEYIHPAWGNKKRIAVVLQDNFPGIAQMMLAETGWVEMKAFAKQLALKFDLSEDARDVPYGISFVSDDIERILIEELRMFNLVEVETESDKYDSKRIRRFRVNRLGRETLTLLPSPAELTDMPKAISVTMSYQGELQLLLNKESESILAAEGMPFLFLLKMWFDSYPQVAAQYPPGTLGLSLNGNPPTDFDSLGEGDVVTIAVAKKRKWVN